MNHTTQTFPNFRTYLSILLMEQEALNKEGEHSQFYIDPQTTTPMQDMLTLSQIFDELHNNDLPPLNAEDMFDLIESFGSLPYTSGSYYSPIIEYFNIQMIEVFLSSLTDEEYKTVEQKLFDLNDV